MRQVYAHEALLELSPGADADAVGAAVTVALCGSVQHEPPCPLAPHETVTTRDGDRTRTRTLFATEPGSESEVRRRIEQALAAGAQRAPTGDVVRWRLLSSGADPVREVERDHGERLIRS